ncbi:MAG: DEAD/DEAH box helicase [Chlamydiota bacterium]|nr:DEAD/DEAH box helicase [Chlamydiota bacterium]
MTGFTKFELHETIIQAIEKVGYQEPTPIQAQTMPIIQQGKDIIALAQTGSGKTAACTIPMCNRVDITIPQIQALIIVPTRELALQYATEAQKIGKIRGVKTFAMYGGEDDSIQETKLQAGVHVLIATPGRLIDFIYSRRIDLTKVATLILDEADEMLSMGFYDDLEFIIQCLIHKHQTLLFSATMPSKIKTLAKEHMIDPVEISLIEKNASPKNILHQFLYCRPQEKEDKLIQMLQDFSPNQSIIFANSRRQCETLQKKINGKIKGVDFLHGGLSQDVRTIITGKFRSGKIKHLIATDVASRGLDFSGITHVFIYHLSDDPDVYVHRSGRTGRVERKGVVTTLVCKGELRTLDKVFRKTKCEAVWISKPPPPASGDSRPPKGRKPYRRRGSTPAKRKENS